MAIKNFDKLIDECIDLFSTEQYDRGAECAREIAEMCKSAWGRDGIDVYKNWMIFVEQSAIKRTGNELVRNYIGGALRKTAENMRGGKIIVPVKH